jgi:hypothetical protein
MTVIPHPPYSLALATCKFFLFPKMKLKLMGRRYDGTEEIQNESQIVMKTLMQNAFQKCFHHGNPAGITVSKPKGTISKRMGQIEISVSG